jgi:peptidoglycan/xylan/chitin deacetylase (PgdA/CDA1 family)
MTSLVKIGIVQRFLRQLFLAACAALLAAAAFSPARAATEIAITVDDLPGHAFDQGDRVKAAETMLAAFRKHRLSGVYGMVNGRMAADPSSRRVIELWVAEGQLLGNHTYSHLDLVKTALPEYLEDIRRNEPVLREMMGGRDFHYFRYPYLAEGDTAEKRDGVRRFLAGQRYRIAPVTVDFFDYQWIEPYQRCTAKRDEATIAWLRTSFVENALDAVDIAEQLAQLDFGRPIKHVLLLHLSQFEADMTDALLSAYEKNGVRFIGLANALSDPAYQFDPAPLVPRSYTFLNQARRAKHLDNPPRVTALYNKLPEDKLAELCK